MPMQYNWQILVDVLLKFLICGCGLHFHFPCALFVEDTALLDP